MTLDSVLAGEGCSMELLAFQIIRSGQVKMSQHQKASLKVIVLHDKK